MSEARDFGFDTRALHAGQRVDPIAGSRAVPIHQTSAYVFEDSDQAADREPTDGVLVEVEGGRAVLRGPALPDPVMQPPGDVTVGSRQCTRGGRIAHSGRCQHDGPEGRQRQGLRDVRRHDRGEVHRSIVGGR